MAFSPAQPNRLQKASQALKEALENYVTICTELTNRYQYCNAGDHVYQRLLDDLTAQLQLNDTKLKETRTIINKTRNCDLPSPRADTLPDEVLIKIFDFVLDTRPARSESYRDEYSDRGKEGPLVEPGFEYTVITHICSAWRQVALSSKGLWTNIDISPLSPFLPRFLARAKTYALLSDDLPVNLHILSDCDASISKRSKICPELINLVISIAPRLHSLELGLYWESARIHEAILGECLSRCRPEIFTRLDIMTTRLNPSSDSCYPFGMLPRHFFFQSEPEFSFEEPDDLALAFTGVSYERFEKLLSGVTTLRLNHLYPMWSSAAYHGLVELHIGSRNKGEGAGPIPESSLAAIFRSSPGLRVLQFSLKVVPGKPCSPINLKSLERLVLETPCADSQRSLLRTISPGRKLFRVNIKLEVPNDEIKRKSGLLPAILNQLRRCVARSKVTEFFLDTNLRHHQVTLRDILKIIPHVRVLGLCRARFDTDGANLCKSLHTLHIRTSLIIFDSFKEFVSKHPLKTITVSHPFVSNGEYDESGHFKELPARSIWDIRRTINVLSFYHGDTDIKILVDGWDY